jgi:exodeoxyribonuclease V alpha subunit
VSKNFGNKTVCGSCGAKFYDLNKVPPVCPKCGIKGSNNSYEKWNPRKKGDGPNAQLWVVRVLEKTSKPVVVIGPNSLNTSELESPGWYFFAAEKNVSEETLNSSKAIQLKRSPLKGVRSYLETYAFKGIGKETAKKFADPSSANIFGDLSRSPEEISSAIGIPSASAKAFKKAWIGAHGSRELHILLRDLGIGHAASNQIIKEYGNLIIHQILSDPFHMVRHVKYFSFEDAQRIVEDLKLDLPEDHKIASAMELCLSRIENQRGHTCAPIVRAFQDVSKIIDVDQDTLDKTLRSMTDRFAFIFSGDKEYISTQISAERDAKIAAGINSLTSDTFQDKITDPVNGSDLNLPGSLSLSKNQELALEIAVKSPVTLITGGPGTGKTTLVVTLVKALKEQDRHITLCAPTGRAAKRLEENPGLRNFKPTTIHFLLAQMKRRKNVNVDVLIVDEASMIDANLMVNILDILEPGNSLIMIGDADQLPPVGPGQVFKDLLSSEQIPTTRLTENFRQAKGSDIIEAAKCVIEGKLPRPSSGSEEVDFEFIEESDEEKVHNLVLDLYMNKLPQSFKFDPSTEIQILSPMRKGQLGIHALNRSIQTRKWGAKKPLVTNGDGIKLFLGDKVIQTSNDYELGVMNGDIGIIQSGGKKLNVSINGKTVVYEPEEAHALEAAYAISIHKSQGSEYPVVIVPITRTHMHMLGRNLLYTAITRGKFHVVMVGDRDVFKSGIEAAWKDWRYTMLVNTLTN